MQKKQRGCLRAHGFTLIELVVVIAIIGVASVLLVTRSDSFAYFREESFLRRLTETLNFLHHQAVQDGEYYRLEFNFKQHSYRVGVIRREEETSGTSENEALAEAAQDSGALSLELAAFLNPDLAAAGTLIPPPSFPSLAEPQYFPENLQLLDVKTMLNGELDSAVSETAAILFSPRWFSEFAVIHLRMSDGSPVTILINPFTGIPKVYRELKDFEWSYDQKKS